MTQYYITYDLTTGRYTGSYPSDVHGIKGEKGSNVPEDAIEVSKEDWNLYVSDQYYYNIETGLCTILPDPLIDIEINRLLLTINKTVNAYICQNYDEGTQQSLQSLYILENTPQEVKDKILLVWNWIQIIMKYYYTCKNEIKLLSSNEECRLYEDAINFTQFDSIKPNVTLEDLYSLL